jgi:hypothetical protein
LRKYILFFILIAPALSLKAQESSYNYTQYSVGVFASQLLPFDDLKIANKTYGFNVTGYYNASPYLNFGAELQFGQISGGSILYDESKRQSKNNYKALVFHSDISVGELVDYSDNGFLGVVKDFYIGSGFGFIYNNMSFIQRLNLSSTLGYAPGTYAFPGKDNSINLMLPIRVGYEYKIYNFFGEPFLGICIGYTHNITLGEGLDGYADPPSNFKNNSPDQFRQITFGIKYNFGLISAFQRQIN